MITPEEFVRRWSTHEISGYDAGQIISYNSIYVEALNIPDESKQFLIKGGLPYKRDSPFIFNLPPNQLPPLSEMPYSCQFDNDFKHFRLLGKLQYGWSVAPYALYCIDESNGGIIVKLQNLIDARLEINNYCKFTVKTQNTSVVHLAELLLLYEEFCRWSAIYNSTNGDVEIYEGHCMFVAESMRDCDPQALAKGSDWAATINAVELGEDY